MQRKDKLVLAYVIFSSFACSQKVSCAQWSAELQCFWECQPRTLLNQFQIVRLSVSNCFCLNIVQDRHVFCFCVCCFFFFLKLESDDLVVFIVSHLTVDRRITNVCSSKEGYDEAKGKTLIG